MWHQHSSKDFLSGSKYVIYTYHNISRTTCLFQDADPCLSMIRPIFSSTGIPHLNITLGKCSFNPLSLTIEVTSLKEVIEIVGGAVPAIIRLIYIQNVIA